MKPKKVTENRAVFTIEEAINFAIDAAQQAYGDATRQGRSESAAFTEAKAAYRNSMPLLETKAAAKCFVAAVAQGVHLEFITAEEARLMLYGAQVWMQLENIKPETAVAG